ncbi:MAG TPA: ABC transporter permease DevC, partial [Microcoleaceae cyanobacterium]
LYQALGVEGVESVSPLYLGFATWRNPTNRKTRQILVIGFDPDNPIFSQTIASNLSPIHLPDTVLFDRASREEFGPIGELFDQHKVITTELSGRRVTVGGLFKLGASFGADGNLITSDINFLRLFGQRQIGQLDVGVIRLKSGADREQVLNKLRAILQGATKDVRVLSKEQFVEFERNYWASSTAIGFIFTLGAAIGFVVGTVIVYQILYTDVSDHLAEYATLKAMGYRNLYLLSVVFQEAFILSIMGYIPALLFSTGLYNVTRNATSLPIYMTAPRSLMVFCLTVIMCMVSGAIAVRRVQDADPADIF